MYAVIETGGKQYRVEVGTELEIELLKAAPGEAVAFERVLLVADGDAASIGRPVVANASVSGEILRRDRGEKLISFKYRPKARRRVKKGHRQELSVVRISDIVLDGKSAARDMAKAEDERKTERQRLADAARKQAEQDAALAAKLAADKAKADKANADKAKADKAKPDKTEKRDTTSKAASREPAKPTAKTSKLGSKAETRSEKTDTTGTVAKSTTTRRKSTDAKSAPPRKTQK